MEKEKKTEKEKKAEKEKRSDQNKIHQKVKILFIRSLLTLQSETFANDKHHGVVAGTRTHS